MLLPRFEYARPQSVAEAVALLEGDHDARPLAGGQSLINVMKLRAAVPTMVVDLNRINELRAIRTDGDRLELGAMATYAEIVVSDDVRRGRPALAETAARIADVQVRSRGTIGGNLCSNDPTNHLPPLMSAVGASMTIRSAAGERVVDASAFFEGVYATAVRPGEVLTSVTVPIDPDARDGWAAVTLGRLGTCIVSAAASVTNGDARIAIGCVAASPVVLSVPADDVSVREAVEGANLDPPSDVHADAAYRRHLAGVCAVRAVRQAIG